MLMLTLSFTGLFLTSCYKQFDPKSYQPAFTINGFTAVDQIKSANLVAYWAFQGSLIDSVSSTAGSSSGTSFVNGFIGQGLSLNVTNSSYGMFDPTTAIKNLQSFTISFWINPTFVSANGTSIDGILGMFTIANLNDFWGYLDWFVENGSNPTAATIKVHLRGSPSSDNWFVKSNVTGLFGKWSNQTITFDQSDTTLTYYMNGTVLGSVKMPWGGPVDFTGIGPMIFGTEQFQVTPSLGTAGGSQPWASFVTGTMDEIRIYNAVLTPAEINALVVLQGKSGT